MRDETRDFRIKNSSQTARSLPEEAVTSQSRDMTGTGSWNNGNDWLKVHWNSRACTSEFRGTTLGGHAVFLTKTHYVNNIYIYVIRQYTTINIGNYFRNNY